MNVLVYAEEQVLPLFLNQLLRTLTSHLGTQYAVRNISHHELTSHPWSTNCALLVFPRFRDALLPGASSSISKFLSSGGSFLAFGANVKINVEPQAQTNHGVLELFEEASHQEVKVEIMAVETPLRVQQPELFDLSWSCFESCPPEYKSLQNVHQIGRDTCCALSFDFGAGKIITWCSRSDHNLFESAQAELFWQRTLTQLRVNSTAQAGKTDRYIRPLPQFLIAAPCVPHNIFNLLPDPSGTEHGVLEDATDTFHFHLFAPNFQIVPEDEHAKTVTRDREPQLVLVCDKGKTPDRSFTPLFDVNAFFDILTNARAPGVISAGSWGMGDVLLYGEIVTSTQTLLERNPAFLAAMPSPLVSMASVQLNGRGRGRNSWISPPGCLQFTTLVRVSLTSFPASRLVFVQYLFALAVVEACRKDSMLGNAGQNVRLKWPNDIYGIVGTEKKKIGGVLVNTSFSGGQVSILIGCGLNIHSSPNISSLSQVGNGTNLSMEHAAATILTTFETMWCQFLTENGSFQAFLDLYLSRWLHSGEIVTVATTTPPMTVRILAITEDYGLLHTVRVRGGSDVEEFVDLQPDGNSFDMMSGLITMKA